ncbi:unnamed protein product [Phyllotreta striolata]|uniref:Dol-P-Glc:Glc(2)Man(9)GlcNAc(2)-PP-Dol alpha-1,2-glucosyltransferase n=1 Tax=Phyllotreta striolata TaxID=444603 RepID=A0A9N9TI71_PHYSR|nr:unnamed protein product [Phyllotreta striolata]
MLLGKIRVSQVCFMLTLALFFATSLIIFNQIYLTSKMVVDEEFHFPLGISYCNFNFLVWDPKVTTLPGLYLVSALLMGPLKLCTPYWMRFVSLLFSLFNVILFHKLFRKNERNEWRNILSSITLALLPPLYFFSNFYYTDVVSLTMILLMMVANEKKRHYSASTFGLLAVICRQTNIVWVGLVAVRYVLAELFTFTKLKQHERGIPAKDVYTFLRRLVKRPLRVLENSNVQFWLDTLAYSVTLGLFVLFLKINGSIVVGDKTAHQATIHIPQLFYFSIFCLIFAWPHFVGEILNFIAFAKTHKLLISIATIVCLVIVFTNTLVHPYMLADNRHYIFYVWNRFYGKFVLFKYAMIPVYIFAWYVIIKSIYSRHDISFVTFYLICVSAVLASQKLIEIRYFFIPYILFRLRIKTNTNSVFNIVLEFVTYVVINCITLNLFFTKIITWSRYEDPQRLIW